MTKYELVGVGIQVTKEQYEWLKRKDESISLTLRRLCKEEMMREHKQQVELEIARHQS